MINDMDKITDTIYLGNINSANIDNLKKENIKKVLTVIDNRIPLYKKDHNINHKIISVADLPTANIIKYFGESLRFIEGDEKILIHCIAGQSRSATIVIAFIMWKQKLSYEEAFKLVNQKRSVAFPNFGFREQLQIFEKLLKDNEFDINQINFHSIEKHGKSPYFEW